MPRKSGSNPPKEEAGAYRRVREKDPERDQSIGRESDPDADDDFEQDPVLSEPGDGPSGGARRADHHGSSS